MNRNPIIPFILIMAMGIGLVFFMSLEGLNNADEKSKEAEHGEKAGGEGEQASSGEFDPEQAYKDNCLSCHGGNYEGGMGPALKGTDKSVDEIKEIIKNGKSPMPAGLIEDKNLDAMAEWIKSLK